MENVIARLKEAAEIKSTIAKQEAAFWQKISEALSDYLHDMPAPIEKTTVPPASSRPASANTYMDGKQAAEYLGISDKTMSKWRCIGGGPKFVKVGRAIRYKVDELENFISKSTFPHTSAYERT